MDDIRETLTRIPLFAGKSLENARVERLGGLTNRNYKVTVGDDSFVLRIPGEGTCEYINRVDEEHNARIAAAAGVNPEVLFFDAADGVQLTRFIKRGVTMDSERFRDLEAVARAARSFKRIHTCGKSFASRFDLFKMMDEYLDYLNNKNARIPSGYTEIQKEAETVREALGANPVPLVPSHCDPLAENFLDTGERMFIVDWEYAGNNDPMWDLGDLSVEAGFGPDQDTAIIEAYFNGKPPPHQVGRMVMYKAMCDLLWTLWGVIQEVNENPAEDFRAYAVGRCERCKTLMGSADFARHLEAVKHGTTFC